MEQVLLLNLPKICGVERLNCPPVPFFSPALYGFYWSRKCRWRRILKKKGGKIARNDMISLIYIKVRTYLIDLKFRILKQMEVLYLFKYEVFPSKRWYVIVKRINLKFAILQFQKSQQISVWLFDTLWVVT